MMAGTALTPFGIDETDQLAVALREEHNKVVTDLETLRAGISEFEASTTWNPSSIADGNEEAKEITVTGAALGDYAMASFSLDVSDLTLNAQVTAANTVTCVLSNHTGGAIDLASGTLRVRTASEDKVDAAGDLVAATVNEGSTVALVDNG
jgi:hypothetical protein